MEIASQENMEVEKEVLHSQSLDSLPISAVHPINYDFEGEVETKHTCNVQQKHIAKRKSERIANLEEGNWWLDREGEQ
jgi:hypothetical protein